MTPPSGAAARLRTLRREARLSQEQVAERSGLSERTIRALESGRAQRPHRDTLRAVAAALGVGDHEQDAFVALWRDADRHLDQLFTGPSPEQDLMNEFARQRKLIRELTVANFVTIEADGYWRSQTIRRSFEVVGPGLDRLLWMNGFDLESIDPDLLEVSECVNVDPGPGLYIGGVTGKVWEGLFRRTLDIGEVYSLAYTIDFAPARRATTVIPDSDLLTMSGVTQPASSIYVEVRFDPDRLPARVFAVSYEAVGAPERVVAELAISPFGVVQSRTEPAPVGTHGIRWEWDRQD